MKRRGLRPAAAVIIIMAVGTLALLGGGLWLKGQREAFEAFESGSPDAAAQKAAANLLSGEFDGVYEETVSLNDMRVSKDVYENALRGILADVDPAGVSVTKTGEGGGVSQYQLFSGSELIGTFSLRKDADGSWKTGFPLYGHLSFVLEVPAGLQFEVNGAPVDESACLERNTPSSNFFQVYGREFMPMVDVYEIGGLLGEPEITANGEVYGFVKDPMSERLLVGRRVEDPEFEAYMIDCGERLAMYPAQDCGLGHVAEIALTSSDWYQKYATLQNYWFTGHNIMNFSEEKVLGAVRQSDDTVVAHVVFDYFADDGEVSRTWHCGYQLTFVEMDGQWLVAGTEICSELNPNQEAPE